MALTFWSSARYLKSLNLTGFCIILYSSSCKKLFCVYFRLHHLLKITRILVLRRRCLNDREPLVFPFQSLAHIFNHWQNVDFRMYVPQCLWNVLCECLLLLSSYANKQNFLQLWEHLATSFKRTKSSGIAFSKRNALSNLL